jgi:ribonucleoside-diphosphate reductase alpha chain
MTMKLSVPISEEIDILKYRQPGESFYEKCTRIANALKDGDTHFRAFREALVAQRFLPAGRVQAAMGAPRAVTPWNCFVMDTIPDSMSGIMRIATEAAMTMRMGGGVGYDFSTLRPRKDLITTLDSASSGPVSFMSIFDAVCQTIASAGHRRGAQMGVLRVDHPDIEEFIKAKRNSDKLTGFNISIGITDEFMAALATGSMFDLKFNGRVYKKVSAVALWEDIMRSTWDWAEPGVLFIDTINNMNNLFYCETIASTNPCAEQPLPPNGACLLGSFNLAQYLIPDMAGYRFDWDMFRRDIPHAVRAMDNVIDRGITPLPAQALEATSKRRMGLGVTGMANCLEAMGLPYGSPGFLYAEAEILSTLRDDAYRASVELAKEKGAFPLFTSEYLEGKFIKTLPQDIQDDISTYGIRNSHLLSIAPTGTISLTALNCSSGVEPVFSEGYDRTIQTMDGPRVERIEDYGVTLGVKPRTTAQCTISDHLNVLATAYRYVDSAVSKTVNVNPNTPWEEFKDVYVRAHSMGCKGITTFNSGGKRYGILNAVDGPDQEEEAVQACFIDPATGNKECG